MVTYGTRRDSPFGALADPTRRAILDLLRKRELRAGEIAGHFAVSRPAVARHVAVLRRTGLVRERRESRSRIYSLDPRGLREVDEWLAPYRLFWSARLADLKRTAEETLGGSGPRGRRGRSPRKKKRKR